MFDVPEYRPDAALDARALVGWLAVHREDATPTIPAVAAGLGWDIHRTFEAVVEAEMAGAVEPWEHHPDGPAVMLSGEWAAHLGLSLVNLHGSLDRFRWRSSRRKAKPRRARRPDRVVLTEVDLSGSEMPPLLDQVVDPDAHPADVLLEMVEAIEARAESLRGRRPGSFVVTLNVDRMRPVYLVGDDSQWDGPKANEARPCHACQGRPLSVVTVCIVCHRSGIDHLIAAKRSESARSNRTAKFQPANRKGKNAERSAV